MLGFRSGTPWKSIIAVIYYSFCVFGFRFGFSVGIITLLMGLTTPTMVAALFDCVFKRKIELVYVVPAWFLALSFAVFIYTYRDYIDIKNIPAEDTAGTVDVFYETDYFTEEVFITRSGNKYHKKDCTRIENSETVGITLREALEAYKTPCSACID